MLDIQTEGPRPTPHNSFAKRIGMYRKPTFCGTKS